MSHYYCTCNPFKKLQVNVNNKKNKCYPAANCTVVVEKGWTKSASKSQSCCYLRELQLPETLKNL